MVGPYEGVQKRKKRVIWSWQEVERQRELIQEAVKVCGIERRNWAALANGQKTVDSFDYQCCVPVLKQLNIFSPVHLQKQTAV